MAAHDHDVHMDVNPYADDNVPLPASVDPEPIDPFLMAPGQMGLQNWTHLHEPIWEGAEMKTLKFLTRHLITQTHKRVSDSACVEQRQLLDDAIPRGLGRSKYLSSRKALNNLINTHSLPGYTRYDMCCVVFADSPWDSERKYADLDECPVCGKSRWVEGSEGKLARKHYHHMPLKDIMAGVYARKDLLDSFVPSLDPDRQDVPDHITQTRGYADRVKKFPQFAKESRNIILNVSCDGAPVHSDRNKKYSITQIMGTVENIKDPTKRATADSMVLMGVIEGPGEPGGQAMQACLNVLVDELLTAWYTGHTFVDSRTRELFVGRAMVLNLVTRAPRVSISPFWHACYLNL